MNDNNAKSNARKGLTLGASTWTYLRTCTFEEAANRLGEMGLQTLDTLTVPPHLWPFDLNSLERRSILRALVSAGVRLESLNLPATDQNLASQTAEMREYTVAQYHALIDLCHDLEAPMLIVVPGRQPSFVPPPVEQSHAWIRSGIEALLPHAEEAGVRLVLENHHLTPMPRVAQMVEFINSFKSPQLGLAYDVANAEFVGENHEAAIRNAAPWLAQVHLSDSSKTKWDHAPIGNGEVDFGTVAAVVREVGFAGTCIMEIVSEAPDDDFVKGREKLQHVGF